MRSSCVSQTCGYQNLSERDEEEVGCCCYDGKSIAQELQGSACATIMEKRDVEPYGGGYLLAWLAV